MKTYNVTAKRWKHGWELHIEAVGVTQSRSIRDAELMVRDYLRLDGVTEPFDVEIQYEVGGELGDEAREARRATKEAAAAQARASEMTRAVARRLRANGLSGPEIAAVLGISKQRVSQLVSTQTTRTAVAKRSAATGQSDDDVRDRWTLDVEFDPRSVATMAGYDEPLDEAVRFVGYLTDQWNVTTDERDEAIRWVGHQVWVSIDVLDALIEPMRWLMLNTVPRRVTLTRRGDR